MDLLVGRPAPESSDRLVLTADPVVVVVVVVVVMVVIVVAGAEADEPRLPLPDPFLFLSHPRQLIARRLARAPAGCRGQEELGSRAGAGVPGDDREGTGRVPSVSGEEQSRGEQSSRARKAGSCFVVLVGARGGVNVPNLQEGDGGKGRVSIAAWTERFRRAGR